MFSRWPPLPFSRFRSLCCVRQNIVQERRNGEIIFLSSSSSVVGCRSRCRTAARQFHFSIDAMDVRANMRGCCNLSLSSHEWNMMLWYEWRKIVLPFSSLCSVRTIKKIRLLLICPHHCRFFSFCCSMRAHRRWCITIHSTWSANALHVDSRHGTVQRTIDWEHCYW